MTKIDRYDIARLLVLARRERANEVHRLLVEPVLRLFERPAQPRASRMLRRHTAFG